MSEERTSEVVFFFYLILRNRIHSGMAPDEARREAYDSVALRYNISRRYLLNLISKHRADRKINTPAFVADSKALIDDLTVINADLSSRIERNEKLIALLEECTDADNY